MNPKFLQINVSEITSDEMKRIVANDPKMRTESNSSSGCYATANCPDGKFLMCTTEISGAECYTGQVGIDGGEMQDVAVVCAGVITYCSGAGDSGTSGSGGENPNPEPDPVAPTHKKL